MRWKKLAQGGKPPIPRSSHTITAVGASVYLWGGEHQPREPIESTIHVYSLDLGTWSQPQVSGDVPSPRNAPSAAAIGGKLYFFGGRTGIDMGEGSLDELFCFDTATSTWSKVIPTGGLRPPKRSYHAMAAQGDKLYVFGGCGEEGRLNDLWQFDTTLNTWRQLPTSDAIKGRGGCGLAATPGALFVIGGFAGREMGDVHRFDLASGRWDCQKGGGAGGETQAQATAGEALTPCGCAGVGGASSAIPARSVFALGSHAGCHACVHGGHLVVFGGEVEPTDQGHAGAGQFSKDILCFDPQTPSSGWHRLSPEGEGPCPRGWMAATSCSQGVIIHGGNSDSNNRLGDMFLLDMHN